jgi:hypothetical protein
MVRVRRYILCCKHRGLTEPGYESDCAEEQAYVLRKSSIMNDLPIPLWSDPETPSISQSVNV